MKTPILTLVVFLIIISFSCVENNPQEEIDMRPAKTEGQYLTEIEACNNVADSWDTISYASYRYDEKRYLKTIEFYYPEAYNGAKILSFEYGGNGKLSNISYHDFDNTLVKEEQLIYPDEFTMQKTVYKLSDGELTFSYKRKIVNDIYGHPIQLFHSNQIDEDFSLLEPDQTYHFGREGNLSFYETHYIGDNFPTSFNYDRKINPFSNAGYDVVHKLTSIPWSTYIDYIPSNNITVITYGSNLEPVSFNLPIEYEGDYPISVMLRSSRKFLYHYREL